MVKEEITKRKTEKLTPELALIVYNAASEDIYVEMREINSKGQLLAGAPLSMECVAQIVTALGEHEIKMPYGIIPKNMIYCSTKLGQEKFIWWNPPRIRQMFFKSQLDIKDGMYHVPGVVYEVNGYTLKIYAFKGKSVTNKTKLYKAPFHNIYNNTVCLGFTNNQDQIDLTYENIINYWEQRFWNTEFTHLGSQGEPTLKPLKEVIQESETNFDYSQLIPVMNNSSLKHLSIKDLL